LKSDLFLAGFAIRAVLLDGKFGFLTGHRFLLLDGAIDQFAVESPEANLDRLPWLDGRGGGFVGQDFDLQRRDVAHHGDHVARRHGLSRAQLHAGRRDSTGDRALDLDEWSLFLLKREGSFGFFQLCPGGRDCGFLMTALELTQLFIGGAQHALGRHQATECLLHLRE